MVKRVGAMDKAITNIDVNRPNWQPTTHAGLPLQDTEVLKEKLLNELVLLDSHAEALQSGTGAYDFSMLQTCKEMIHSRRVLYNQLNK